MSVTASGLRKNIYKLLDETLETRKPLRIKRKGRELEVISVSAGSKFSRLSRHDCIVGDPESIVSVNWEREWNDDLP